MSERWATIIKSDDGQEVISSIAQMEGVPPEVRDDQKKNIRVQRVADGVKIGMVKSGPVDTVAGWGFPEGTPPTAAAPKTPVPSNPDEKSRAAPEADKADAKAAHGKKAA